MNSRMHRLKVSCEPKDLDEDYVINFLKTSYWAKDRSKASFRTSFQHSICFSLLLDEKQIGFARVVTDRTVFAYLMDVFIDESYKGLGYGSFLLEHILKSPELINVEGIKLATHDAHSFYLKKGFKPVSHPEYLMEKTQTNS